MVNFEEYTDLSSQKIDLNKIFRNRFNQNIRDGFFLKGLTLSFNKLNSNVDINKLVDFISNYALIKNYERFNYNLKSLKLIERQNDLNSKLSIYFDDKFSYSLNWEEMFGIPITSQISDDFEDEQIIEYKFNLPISVKNTFDLIIIKFISTIFEFFIDKEELTKLFSNIENIENNKNINLFKFINNFIEDKNYLINVNLEKILDEILDKDFLKNIKFRENYEIKDLFNEIENLLSIYDEINFIENKNFIDLCLASKIEHEIYHSNHNLSKFCIEIDTQENLLKELNNSINIDKWLELYKKQTPLKQEKINFSLFDEEKLLNLIEKYESKLKNDEDDDNKATKGIIKLIKKYILLKENSEKFNYYKLIKLPNLWKDGLIKLKSLMPNFSNVINYLIKEFTKIDFKKETFKLPNILLAGKNGIGKRFFIENLTKILNIENNLIKIDLSTLQNDCNLVGSSHFYGNSQNGKIFQYFIDDNYISNPIFLLENINKINKTSDSNQIGNIFNSTLKILTKKEMKNFRDENVPEIDIDASNITWFAITSNLENTHFSLKEKFKIFEIPILTKTETKKIIHNIYQNIILKENFDKNYFQKPLNDNIIDKLSSLNPIYIEKILNNAINNAIFDNQRTELLDKDFQDKEIELIIENYSNKIDVNLSNSIDFKLYNFNDFENFRNNDFIFENVKINISNEMLPYNQYKLRLLNKNWEKILDEFEKLYPNFTEFAKILKGQLLSIEYSQNKENKIFKLSKPILLAGEGGIGKTAGIRWLANKFNVPFEIIDMNLEKGSSFLSGYENEKPGKIFSLLTNQAISNPIIVLDELDKSVQINGDFASLSPLYSLLEEKSAVDFKDVCVKFAINTSYISWIAIANDISSKTIPSHLLTRFNVCQIHKPTPQQNHIIIQNIFQKICKDKSIENIFVQNVSPEVLKLLEDKVPRTNIRILEEAIGNALTNKRTYIVPQDIKEIQERFKNDVNINNKKENKSIGFLNLQDNSKN